MRDGEVRKTRFFSSPAKENQRGMLMRRAAAHETLRFFWTELCAQLKQDLPPSLLAFSSPEAQGVDSEVFKGRFLTGRRLFSGSLENLKKKK